MYAVCVFAPLKGKGYITFNIHRYKKRVQNLSTPKSTPNNLDMQ